LLAGAVATSAVGVTWALTSSQTTLAASSISSTTANLEIRSTNKNWTSSAPGFKMNDLIPGTGITENVYFKNAGKIGLILAAHIPKQPASIRGGNGFTGWNNVLINITGNSCGATVDTTMAALLGSIPVTLPCGTLTAGATGNPNVTGHVGNYSLHFDLNQSAITGDHAGVGTFDIQFTGTQ